MITHIPISVADPHAGTMAVKEPDRTGYQQGGHAQAQQGCSFSIHNISALSFVA